ncbi:MAG: sigma-70 family RNA polymerase sigma factor [Planctomycetaceae bacterium]|nr:sigma-70 family RNA polymerase sigma factor [Planctomycetaceae bacterium]
MTKRLNPTTSLSLLERLQEESPSPVTWEEFVGRYRPVVFHWCRKWGLQEEDAQDVTQNVLLALSQQMGTYKYRPERRFRSWLKTISHRAWIRFLESRKREPVTVEGIDRVQALDSVDAQADFMEMIELESNRQVLEMAMEYVRQRVQPTTWEAFQRTAVMEHEPVDVAQELGLSVMAVYRARCRVQKMLQEEVELLDGSSD